MTQERLTVHKIREILRLKEAGLFNNRAIALSCKISNSTVGEYLRRAQAAGLHWPLPEGMREDELYQKLFPQTSESTSERPVPDWSAVNQKLKKKGVHPKAVVNRVSRQVSERSQATPNFASTTATGLKTNLQRVAFHTRAEKNWKAIMPS